MSRVNSIGIIITLVLVVAVGCSTTQKKSHPLWEKTVTLPSGEVVLDLSGEWDTQGRFHGALEFIDPIEEVMIFTQESNSFTGCRQSGPSFMTLCFESIRGELDQDGFIVVYALCGTDIGNIDWVECKWDISIDGNSINLDCGECLNYSLTRKQG